MHPRICELLEYLDAQRAGLRTAFDAVPEACREATPDGNGWSAANTIEHLAIVEQRIAGVMGKKIDEARAHGVAADPDTAPILPALGLARVLDRSRRANAPPPVHPTGACADDAWAALDRGGAAIRDVLLASADVNLGAISHPHPLFGPLSLYEWVGFVGAHEARHAEQIREIAAAYSPQR